MTEMLPFAFGASIAALIAGAVGFSHVAPRTAVVARAVFGICLLVAWLLFALTAVVDALPGQEFQLQSRQYRHL